MELKIKDMSPINVFIFNLSLFGVHLTTTLVCISAIFQDIFFLKIMNKMQLVHQTMQSNQQFRMFWGLVLKLTNKMDFYMSFFVI